MDTRTETQFSVFLVNKPGVLAQVTGALAKAKLNVVAMTLVDSQEHGVLRLVFDDAGTARGVLSKLNLPMTETEVLCLDLSNRPGALADVYLSQKQYAEATVARNDLVIAVDQQRIVEAKFLDRCIVRRDKP